MDIMDHLNSSSHITAGAIAKIKLAFSVDEQSERELIRENEWMVTTHVVEPVSQWFLYFVSCNRILRLTLKSLG